MFGWSWILLRESGNVDANRSYRAEPTAVHTNQVCRHAALRRDAPQSERLRQPAQGDVSAMPDFHVGVQPKGPWVVGVQRAYSATRAEVALLEEDH